MPHDPNALTPVIDRRRAAETRIMAADERETSAIGSSLRWFTPPRAARGPPKEPPDRKHEEQHKHEQRRGSGHAERGQVTYVGVIDQFLSLVI